MRSFRLVLLPLIASACGQSPLGTPPDLPDGATNAVATTDAEVPAGATCRWQGYGIGFGERSQCASQHLLSHALVECQAAGGFPTQERTVAGHCPAEAEEVQVSCCFAHAVPAPEDTPVANVVPLDRRAAPGPGDDTRATLTADAEAACASAGSHLGDWSVLYGADGISAELLRFGCSPYVPLEDTVSVHAGGRSVKFHGPDQVTPECINGHKGFGAVNGDRLHLNLFAITPGHYDCSQSEPGIWLDWEGGEAAALYHVGPDGRGGGVCELDIYSIRPRFRGAFAATLRRADGDGPDQMALTEGTFDVALPTRDCP